MRVIAIANQKGGCGKTTTTVNLAAAFGRKGKRVLVVDLDPQGHSTLGLGCDPESFNKTIYNAIVDKQVPITDVIVSSKTENVDVAPSNVLLSGAELDLATVSGREFMLTEQFKTIDDKYDICVIDCPPSLGILTLNALISSTDLIVPVQVHYYAMEGLKQLFETCEIITEHFYPCKVKITGLLLTFVEDRLIFTRQIAQQMREFFGELVFLTVIHRNVRLAEAPSAGESVITYAPDSRGAIEYMTLVDEILHGKEFVRNQDRPSSETPADAQAEIQAAADGPKQDAQDVLCEIEPVQQNGVDLVQNPVQATSDSTTTSDADAGSLKQDEQDVIYEIEPVQQEDVDLVKNPAQAPSDSATPSDAGEDSLKHDEQDVIYEIEPVQQEDVDLVQDSAQAPSDSATPSDADADSLKQDEDDVLYEIEPVEQEDLVPAPVDLSSDVQQSDEQSETNDDAAPDVEDNNA
ncbi:MAG: AAA family ATPase [Sedimentisphaerales bacterium]|nr:AAA family ATPase [Sedimentisphaerales bacterium]